MDEERHVRSLEEMRNHPRALVHRLHRRLQARITAPCSAPHAAPYLPVPDAHRHPSPGELLDAAHDPLDVRRERDHLDALLVQPLPPVHLFERPHRRAAGRRHQQRLGVRAAPQRVEERAFGVVAQYVRGALRRAGSEQPQ